MYHGNDLACDIACPRRSVLTRASGNQYRLLPWVRDGSFQLEVDSAGTLVVRIMGNLDEALGRDLRAQVAGKLNGGVERVLVDLSALENCELLGRAELRELQVELRGRVKRTAYIATRPRFRGVCHIVIHGAEDEHAMAFSTRSEAERWVLGDEGRLSLTKLGVT